MISIQNISFSYQRNHRVLKDFSLEIPEGGVYGLLGKNGTGKSTLLYLMTGLLTPQSGSVVIDGRHPEERDPELLKEMFIVPEEFDLPRIPLKDYVNSLKPFYPGFDEALAEKMLHDFEMPENVNLGALSMGQKKKVYMCVALASNTKYLFMDEPTNGLDILSKSQFRKVVAEGMTPQRTVIISTHQVHDVENLLDHVVIVDDNRVLLNAPIEKSADTPVDLEKLFIETLGK